MDPRGAGFSTAPLRRPGGSPGQRAAQRPLLAGMMHSEAYRGNPREGSHVVLVGLDPGSTGDRETDVTSHLLKASSPGWAAIATAHPAGADLWQASGRRQTQTKARLPHMPQRGREPMPLSLS
jgi:hypothetical protein